MKFSYNEFHISRTIRDLCQFDQTLYSSSGNVIFADLKAVRTFQVKLNQVFKDRGQDEKQVSAGSLNAMGLIDEIFHYVCMLFRRDKAPLAFTNLLSDLDTYFGKDKIDSLLMQFMEEFPPVAVYQKKLTASDYLIQSAIDPGTGKQRSNREQVLEELVMLHLANENPAFHPFQILFDDTKLNTNPTYIKTWNQIKAFFMTQPVFGPKDNTLIDMLKEPVIASPTSLKGQLDYIRTYWADLLGEWLKRLLEGIDTITEEEKASWSPINGGEVSMDAYSYENLMQEYERFSPDQEWMPKVVLMAKTVLVWLFQLSKQYGRDITRLDQIPDEELNRLRDEGFTGLWLIGLWERSYASKRIKQINGNPEAAASAYSLLDYEIAGNLGGWEALDNLRRRCWTRGIRLASDMVPNHTGMDGKWVIEHPDLFITSKDCPFPQYSFNGENLSQDGRVSLYLEDHYYSKSDCAVCFKRVDNQTGDVTYIYHGNDGTGMPWNDTAQIDFLNPTAREAVIQQIMKVAANFPIIRFDAAMVLAKKHIRRLWYPEPGHGGDIATRSQHALTTEQFEAALPNEFWREVVDRCAQEMPDTLLLAEAFWMMEGYFTRTLGMHRVYNSAFMNMLKKEENQKYRDTVKNTIKFDPQVLKRFVNFMNNPDEETAVAQFGKGDKYFGVCTLMITMPGLPMFGHGQIEGFEEKYGMEYTRAYRDEKPDQGLVDRHWHDIFPLLHKRYLFSGVENFLFYDVWNNGQVNENIFAYSNGAGAERTIVFYNNKYDRAAGWIKQSCEYAVKTGSGENDIQMYTRSLAEGIGLTSGNDHFMIFREHKSGLWFVRKSDDIINQGMFVALNGFEYQVYLDVQQVTDTVEGKYAKLNELLAGSGVPDLEVAWEEYRYKDLYAALAKFATPELLESLHNLFTPVAVLKANKKTLPDLKAVFDSAKEAALEYYEKESEFALQAEKLREQERLAAAGEKKSKKHGASSGTQKEMRVSKKATESTPEERFKSFCRQIEYLATTMADAQGVKSTKDGATVSRNKISDTAFKTTQENVLYSGLMNYDCAPEILSAFAMVSSAGRKNCLAWAYDRKLTELLGKAEIKTPGMKETLRSLFFMMRVRDFNFGASSFGKSAYESAKLLVDGPNSPLLVGTNEFNGIKWFNKEKMESAMWYCLAAVTMFSPRILREQIYRLYRTLTAAKESSEYQCEKFLESLKPNPKTSTARQTKAKEAKDEKEAKGKKEVKSVKKAPQGKAKKSASGSGNSKQK
ncbi:MAG: alpha-amylase [Treponema sp.]|nr:alpha-amylase [Treponema sp.]